MKNIKKIVIYAVVIIAVISVIVVVKKSTSSSTNNQTAVKISKTAVETKTVQTSEKNSNDEYKATLEAGEQGIITSKLSAKVIKVSIENGQYVNVGDSIATLDDTDIQNSIKAAQAQLKVNEQQVNSAEQQLNSAQISLEKLQINLDDSQRNYDRQKTLFDSGAIAKADFEVAETKLNSAKADFNSGKSNIETAKSNIETAKASVEAQNVNIEKLQNDLSNVIIKAPISGVISDKAINIGQVATQGTAIAKVNDISTIYATIQVPQEKINNTKVGQAATVTIEGSDRTYDGTVQNIDLSADTQSRVFNCKIKIDNSDKSLYPGVYGKAELFSSEKAQVITVPINILVGDEGDYSVFINDNGKAKKQKVEIGDTDDKNIEITEGLNDGDQVISTNTSTLQEGDEIEVTSNQDENSSETNTEQNGDSTEEVSK